MKTETLLVVSLSLSADVLGLHVGDVSFCSDVVRRKEWGALHPKSKINTRPVSNVILHHSLGPTCITEPTCRSIVRTTQLQHIKIKGWDDIGYNFLVSENGQVFEGRGWGVEAAAVMGLTDRAVHIAIIGSFNHRTPADAAMVAVSRLIQCGMGLGKVHEDYKISAHRDVEPTACPGHKLYALIRGWNRYVKTP
ncbi:peptidoglycan recognition protein 1 [Galendromus occidentalis]|uniref:Peptidoglycan recognition protein 1 n=1 Tax=Galendromus occidentalis TaxID=34638 RepID=A0AAJ6VY92_9ACAR|nr:peptidoglycan recognition protein 1 [Galendromus occidentalis]